MAHGNFVSLFDIISRKWRKTFSFEEQVIRVFRNDKGDKGNANIGLQLNSNKVKLIDTIDNYSTEFWQVEKMT